MKAIQIVGLALAVVLQAAAQNGSVQKQQIPDSFSAVRQVGETGTPGARRMGSPIRVVTWNIDHGGHWKEMADELHREAPALLLLQEVDWDTSRTGREDVAAELARALGVGGSFGIEFEELSQEQGGEREGPAYIGQATLSSLPLKRSYVLRFARQSGFWKPRGWIPSSVPLMQRRLGDRIALVNELEFAGKPLVVYNAHLESRSAGKIQAEQLDEMLADCKRWPPGASILLGGDLNTKYLPSVFLHKLERAGFHSALGERIERTHRIAMALDWIFVKGSVRLSGGEVDRSMRGSDHYPVFATLAGE